MTSRSSAYCWASGTRPDCSMRRLMPRMAWGLLPAISPACASASSRGVSLVRVTRPSRAASSPVTVRPVQASSLATSAPTSRGSVAVPVMSGESPHRISITESPPAGPGGSAAGGAPAPATATNMSVSRALSLSGRFSRTSATPPSIVMVTRSAMTSSRDGHTLPHAAAHLHEEVVVAGRHPAPVEALDVPTGVGRRGPPAGVIGERPAQPLDEPSVVGVQVGLPGVGHQLRVAEAVRQQRQRPGRDRLGDRHPEELVPGRADDDVGTPQQPGIVPVAGGPERDELAGEPPAGVLEDRGDCLIALAGDDQPEVDAGVGHGPERGEEGSRGPVV